MIKLIGLVVVCAVGLALLDTGGGTTYDKLLQENERLKRVADDAREKLDAAMDRPAELSRLFGAASEDPTLKGFGLKLDAFADGLVASGGTLSTRTTSLRSAIQRNEKEMDKVVDRASRAEARYLAQYNAMDAVVSRMNSLNAYVAQQITLWNKSSG